jgi:hypothetical protein
MLLERHEFSELGKADRSRRERNAIERKHRSRLLWFLKCDADSILELRLGIWIGRDLSGLEKSAIENPQSKIEWRDRTDSNRHRLHRQ